MGELRITLELSLDPYYGQWVASLNHEDQTLTFAQRDTAAAAWRQLFEDLGRDADQIGHWLALPR